MRKLGLVVAVFSIFAFTFGCKNFLNSSSSTTDETPAAGSPEIDVQQNGVSLVSGTGSKGFGNAGIGLSKDFAFTIKNTGTGALSLSGTPFVALSGTDAASFSVKTQPASATVAAGGTGSFTLSFTPTSAGSKTATVTIKNNDADEGTYAFTVTGTSGAPGTLDAGFGTSGIATLSLLAGATTNQSWRVSAEQPDGKIVTIGHYSNGTNPLLVVGRYTETGVLDTTFGQNGTVSTGIEFFGTGQDPQTNAVFLDSEGRILVVGYLEVSGGAALMLLRYTSSGVLDSTFGTNGLVKTTFAGSTDVEGYDAVIQADGKILVAGMLYDGTNSAFLLARFTSSGSLDTSFAGAGYTVNSLGGSDCYAVGVGVYSVGGVNKIYVGGTRDYTSFAMVRYNLDGTPDSSYGTSGVASWTSGASQCNARSVKVQADGKVLVAGKVGDGSNWDYAVARFNSDGSLDSGFGTSGSIIRDTPTATALEHEGFLAIQSNGKIILAGYSNFSSAYHMVVWSINADGSPDISFGSSGFAYIPTYTITNGLTIQNGGQILVSGQTFSAGESYLTLARFWP